MRRARWFALLLLAAVCLGRIAPAGGQSPGPLAGWAMSGGTEPAPLATARPPVIAASRPATAPKPPPENGVRLPDDGLRHTAAATTTGTSRPVQPVQQAVYLAPVDPPPTPPIRQVMYTQPEIPATVAAPGRSSLTLDVTGPSTGAPGQVLPCRIQVRNQGALVLGGVSVELPVAQGVRILETRPEAERDGDRIRWNLGNLDPAAERTLEFEVQGSAAGEVYLAPGARFTAVMAHRTAIVRPPFALQVQGPDSAAVGEKVVFQVQVGNHTQEPIRKVALRCELSAGLLHPQGQVIEADLAEDLAPGQVRTIQLETQARQPGRHTASLVAVAEGSHKATTHASLVVSEPNLTLQLEGPRLVNLGLEATLQLVVTNPAIKPVGPVRVTQTLPQGLEFVSASHQGTFNPVSQSVVWTVGEMRSEQRQVLTCQVRARQVGDWALAGLVQLDNLPGVRSTFALRIESPPTLALEVTARDDPISVGRVTTYEVRVYNSGQAGARGVRLVLQLPDHLTAVQANGPTLGQIRGQQVFFEPMAEMRARVDAIYRVQVRGVRAGEGRFAAALHAAGMARPLEQELTSHVQQP